MVSVTEAYITDNSILKTLITTAANDKLFVVFIFFREHKGWYSLWNTCKQKIHMKYQYLFAFLSKQHILNTVCCKYMMAF